MYQELGSKLCTSSQAFYHKIQGLKQENESIYFYKVFQCKINTKTSQKYHEVSINFLENFLKHFGMAGV
jgi:hypothetical protein